MGEIPVFIISFDGYSALWEGCLARVKRHLGQKRIYLLSNYLAVNSENVVNLRIGEDRDWSSNVLAALQRIPEDYILVIMDDVFIRSAPDAMLWADVHDFVRSRKPAYLNLKATPTNFLERLGTSFIPLPPGRLYRNAVVPAIWARRELERLLVAGESAWEFEVRGSERSDGRLDYYATPVPVLDFLHVIVNGKITAEAERELTTQLEVPSGFSPMGTLEKKNYWFRKNLSRFLNELPFNLRTRLSKFAGIARKFRA